MSSCSNDDLNQLNNQNENKAITSLNSDFNAGQMHNDILDIYYVENAYISDDFRLMEGAVDQYLKNNYPLKLTF